MTKETGFRARALDALARALALFFGAFMLASALGAAVHPATSQSIWWLDLSAIPEWLALGFESAAAALLVAWSFGTARSRIQQRATMAATLVLATAAIANVVAYYVAWLHSSVSPLMPVPVSALYAVGFVWLWRRVSSDRRASSARSGALGVAVCLVGLVLLFPLVQIAFFGTTDYRRPAGAAVVLGARVYDNGALSTALEDRVRTGVDLYRSGLVTHLIMSGGVGANGIDETVAMKRRAIEMGVPSSAIVRDNQGENTDATVVHTTAIFRAMGIHRVLAVSQFWHLPRVKLGYLSSGWDVSTVPASASTPILQTPYLVLREIPAFWEYWVRAL